MQSTNLARNIAGRFAIAALVAIGLAVSSTTIHEVGHQVVAHLYGIEGEIKIHILGGGFAPEAASNWQTKAGGGGIAAAFMMGTFWLAAFLTRTPMDTYLELAALHVAIGHLCYAWVEAAPQLTLWPLAMGLSIAGYLAVLFLSRHRLLKWSEAA